VYKRQPYWDWTGRAKAAEFYQYFAGTAPTHHIFGLNEALAMLKEEGMQAVWARHDRLARTVWAAFDAWGQGNPEIRLNVADPTHRGRAVTAARIGGNHGTALRNWCEREAGVTLGIGLGMAEKGDPA
ncbi:aminotransferase class V-fold PLP-dependent enzyme, partial [Thioclava sp. BHET1]